MLPRSSSAWLLEVLALGYLRDLLGLTRLVDLDAEFLELTLETFLAGADFGSHPLEDSGELTQRVAAFADNPDSTRLAGARFNRARGGGDVADLVEVFELGGRTALLLLGLGHRAVESARGGRGLGRHPSIGLSHAVLQARRRC